jgi:hypothetical protein
MAKVARSEVRYITPLTTTGPVWKLTCSPVSNVQTGRSRATLAVVMSVSGEKRSPAYVRL